MKKKNLGLGSSPRWRKAEWSLNRSKLNIYSSPILSILGFSGKEHTHSSSPCWLKVKKMLLLSDDSGWGIAEQTAAACFMPLLSLLIVKMCQQPSQFKLKSTIFHFCNVSDKPFDQTLRIVTTLCFELCIVLRDK